MQLVLSSKDERSFPADLREHLKLKRQANNTLGVDVIALDPAWVTISDFPIRL